MEALLSDKKFFRVMDAEEQLLLPNRFDPGDDDELDAGPHRHQLLQLRENAPFKFDFPIPLLESEIKRSRRLMRIVQEANAQKKEDVTGPDTREHDDRVSSFLRRVQMMYRQQSHTRKQRVASVGEIVQEDEVPIFAAELDVSAVIKFFEPRRRLRPTPMEQQAATALVPDCKLVMQVVRAINVPIRSEVAKLMQGDEFAFELESVMSFVEIRFQTQRQRTSAHEGPAPIWNETHELPITIPGPCRGLPSDRSLPLRPQSRASARPRLSRHAPPRLPRLLPAFCHGAAFPAFCPHHGAA